MHNTTDKRPPLCEIKNARQARKTRKNSPSRCRDLEAQPGASANPTADKALINSKILEACVQADFSPQAALKSVSGAYFALNQRSGKRPLEQKAKASDQDTSANNPIGNACPQDVGRFMNRRELVHTLDHETMAARISTVCKTAKGDAERAFEILLKSLNSP